ncbi:MAG: Ig-like domain-containing protein [Streptosporangiaceae bacterium]
MEPSLETWPTGQVSLSLENCGGTDIDVLVSVRHQGSNWSRGWNFELQADEGPFEFSESFDPPAGGRRGEFEVEISAEGIPIARMRIQGRRAVIPRKLIVTAAVVLVGAAIGTALALLWPGSALASQSIVFTSAPPTGPAPGGTYVVTAKGGASGNQVFITIDSPATSVCSISGSTVTFNQPGTCTIDANQAGNAHYQPAPQAQQTVTVNSGTKISQSISFTSTPPAGGEFIGDTYMVSASGGASGNQVVIIIDSSSTSVCSISGSTVTFNQPGTCTIDANQAGNATYQPAPQAQQTVTVNQPVK